MTLVDIGLHDASAPWLCQVVGVIARLPLDPPMALLFTAACSSNFPPPGAEMVPLLAIRPISMIFKNTIKMPLPRLQSRWQEIILSNPFFQRC